LVRLLVGSNPAAELPVASDRRANLAFAELEPNGTDLVPAPENPLNVAFWVEDSVCIVGVRGLCRVPGRPAQVCHGLKAQFDADREAGLDPVDHEYVPATKIPDVDPASKESVRKAVERCRDTLAQAYKDMHGHGPSRPLLIQTNQSRGYRLDPEIVVIRPEELN
jgi:hypothetical protein